MNYKHIYHAGNFADVIKHITLITVLEQIIKKDKPFTILDCFAGSGIYDLESIQATKSNENQVGIKQIYSFIERHGIDTLPDVIQKYLYIINHLNKKFKNIVGATRFAYEKQRANTTAFGCMKIDIIGNSRSVDYNRFYPGSPTIIANYLKNSDELIASELHIEEYNLLKKLFYRNSNIHIHHLNAYHAMKAFTPLPNNRGMIFIDPPFEKTDEFENIIKYLEIIQDRTKSIPIMIWYPIKSKIAITNFYNKIKSLKFKEKLTLEFQIQLNKFGNYKANAMNAMGIIIINPPCIQDQLHQVLSFIKKNIYINHVNFNIL